MQEITIDYSNCNTTAPFGNDASTFAPIPANKVSSYFKSTSSNPPTWKRNMTDVSYGSVKVPTGVCSLQFEIPDELKPPVLFYYQLTNFYQNHRRYVKSLDTDQLKGTAVPVKTIKDGSCDPLRLAPNNKTYYPCGLIANSLFNDTFFSPVLLNVPGSDADNRT